MLRYSLIVIARVASARKLRERRAMGFGPEGEGKRNFVASAKRVESAPPLPACSNCHAGCYGHRIVLQQSGIPRRRLPIVPIFTQA